MKEIVSNKKLPVINMTTIDIGSFKSINEVIKAAKEFEDQMNKVKDLISHDVEKIAISIARESSYSKEDIASAMKRIASKGLDISKIHTLQDLHSMSDEYEKKCLKDSLETIANIEGLPLENVIDHFNQLSDNEDLLKRCDKLQSTIDEYSNVIDKLQESLQEHKNKVKELDKECSALYESDAGKAITIQQLLKERDNFKERLKSTLDKNKNLSEQVNTLTDEKKALRSQLAALDNQVFYENTDKCNNNCDRLKELEQANKDLYNENMELRRDRTMITASNVNIHVIEEKQKEKDLEINELKCIVRSLTRYL